MKGVKAALKNGGPTLNFLSKNISASSGHIVPMNTTKQATASSTLFTSKADSRLTMLNTPFASSALARAANRNADVAEYNLNQRSNELYAKSAKLEGGSVVGVVGVLVATSRWCLQGDAIVDY